MARKLLIPIIAALSFSSSAMADDLKLRLAEHLFDIKGAGGSPFSLPTDVVVAKDGNIYVLDGVHNMVKVFNPNGGFIAQFGKKGVSGGAFDTPVGMGIDRSDNIYICDTKNSRIVIFDKKGSYSGEVVLKTVKSGMTASRPVDIAVDDNRGLLYITDSANHTVLVYTKKGNFIRLWGERGGEPGQFRYPATVAVNGKKLFVTDVLGTRVQVVDIDTWTFAGQIGKWGVLAGELFRPKGVAVDSNGLVYVADSYMDVIQVFNEYGEFLYVLGDKNKHIRRFVSPAAIFIDKKNRLYVVEMLLNKVGVYKIK